MRRTLNLDQIRHERERRDETASRIASTIPPGDYYAFDNSVEKRIHDSTRPNTVAECVSHSEAVAVLLKIARRVPDVTGIPA